MFLHPEEDIIILFSFKTTVFRMNLYKVGASLASEIVMKFSLL